MTPIISYTTILLRLYEPQKSNLCGRILISIQLPDTAKGGFQKSMANCK
jgi:hypothetical protein